jgi:hypothetical protein
MSMACDVPEWVSDFELVLHREDVLEKDERLLRCLHLGDVEGFKYYLRLGGRIRGYVVTAETLKTANMRLLARVFQYSENVVIFPVDVTRALACWMRKYPAEARSFLPMVSLLFAISQNINDRDCCFDDIAPSLKILAHTGRLPTRGFAPITTWQATQLCDTFQSALSTLAVEKVCFDVIRHQLLEYCIALQELSLPAWCTTLIMLEAAAPFAAMSRLWCIWTLVTKVKHLKPIAV